MPWRRNEEEFSLQASPPSSIFKHAEKQIANVEAMAIHGTKVPEIVLGDDPSIQNSG